MANIDQYLLGFTVVMSIILFLTLGILKMVYFLALMVFVYLVVTSID